MSIVSRVGSKWKTLMVLAPLILLVALAVATGSFTSAGSAEYGAYGMEYTHMTPDSSYDIHNNMLFVANGRDSDVKVVDVGTMSIVDTIPIPNEVTPGFLYDLNPDLMNWEIHGVVPSEDRGSVYAVGALSGGSYPLGAEGDGNQFRLADYEMYQVDAATKQPIREIPLQSAGDPVNPVGYCGLEYNLNDESSDEIVATSMNTGNALLNGFLHIAGCYYQDTDPSGTCTDVLGVPNSNYTTDPNQVGLPVPFQLVEARGTGYNEVGGWVVENISTGTSTSFINTDFNNNQESSTCGVSWNADGTRAYATQMWEPLISTVDWTTQTADGQIARGQGNSYHQNTTDKARGLLFATSENGVIDVYDTNTELLVGTINMRDLLGTSDSRIHGIDFSPNDPDIAYVTCRNTPGPGPSTNSETVVDLADINAPVVKGQIGGFAESVCGVYAIGDKSEYYGTEPSLTLSKTSVYWGSYADYTAGLLSVDYSIGNAGAADASDVSIVGSNSTNGVIVATALPLSAGDIAGGSSASVTLQYHVPGGTGVFMTSTSATAQNGATIYSYPGPTP